MQLRLAVAKLYRVIHEILIQVGVCISTRITRPLHPDTTYVRVTHVPSRCN